MGVLFEENENISEINLKKINNKEYGFLNETSLNLKIKDKQNYNKNYKNNNLNNDNLNKITNTNSNNKILKE